MRAMTIVIGVAICAAPAFANNHGIDDQGRRARAAALSPAPIPHDTHAPRDAGWQALGPFGGDAQIVAFDPANTSIALCGIAPAGSSGGTMFRSADGGQSWTEVAALSGTSVYDIDFTPTGTAFASADHGIWKSTDGGNSWTNIDLGIGLNQQTFDVTVDTNNPSVIWAGVADAIGSQPANVLKSTNGGTTWSNVTPTMTTMSATSIAINPTNSNNVVVTFRGSFGGGAVWVTDNGGANWTNRSAGLPGNPMNAAAHSGTTIYVGGGQAFGSQYAGLYASTNDGFSWTPLHDGTWPQAICRGVTVDPNDPNTIFAAAEPGIHKSTDGGATWQIGVGGSGTVTANSVTFVPGSTTNVFAAVNGRAVLASSDTGDTFQQSAEGIGALNVVSVAGDPNDANRLAIAFEGLNDGGVFSTDDGGQSWTAEPVPPTRYSAVGYDDAGRLFAISSGPSSVAPEGLYRREGNGSWTGLGPDQGTLFESDLSELLFGQPGSGLVILVGADFGVAGHEATIWRSTDEAATWTKVVERDPDDFRVFNDVIFVPGTGETQLVASLDDSGSPQNGLAVRSTDAGATWSDAATGLLSGVRPQQLAANDTMVYLAASQATIGAGGLYRSIDGGQTWTKSAFASQLFGVAKDPADDNVVYARQFAAPKVLRSDDAGDTFTPFSDGLEAAATSRDLELAADAKLVFGSGSGSYAYALITGCNAADLAEPYGILDLDDIQAFIVAFVAGDAAADVNGDGVLDLADIQDFIIAFTGGCP